MNTILIPIIITIVTAIITFITFSREKPSQFGLPVMSIVVFIGWAVAIIISWVVWFVTFVSLNV